MNIVKNKNKLEFVNANLLPNKIENIGTISNCSKGEYNINNFYLHKLSGIEPLLKDLQSFTLPLCYLAEQKILRKKGLEPL